MATRRVGDLKINKTIYPRTQVDSTTVGAMLLAYNAGRSFPPIIVRSATDDIVDGAHRRDMYNRAHGEDFEVEVEEREYANDGEAFLDAWKLNNSHGRPLTSYERALCALKAKRFRIGMKRICEAVGVTEDFLRAVADGRIAKTPSGGNTPLKATIAHLSGQTLTAEQCEANDRLTGMRALAYVNQVQILLDTEGFIDWQNEGLVAGLERLRDRLNEVLAERPLMA